MQSSLHSKLLARESTSSVSSQIRYRSLYSDRALVRDLDIVNELEGHSGCVNALSWSTSGQLLASGSDDTHLNIHSYQSHDTDKQFQLRETVATGHTQNIFSVKFMPHSNDRTVVSCAGDGEVRVFDLEYAGTATTASNASTMAAAGRRRGRDNVYNGVKYLTDGETNARVYRSHSDRVKRIVTESSPYHFLTCSEDGEVRQWDTRLPSSAYPPNYTSRLNSDSDDNIPPPLISYKRFNLDLNTISCSATQPHYIALGGAHLHCFLHDRRMIGRDRSYEAGRSGAHMQDHDMNQATRCVRKFAPRGQRKMLRNTKGHITACKISDARPDEMVVSWSADHVYSFDLIRSPDAEENDEVSRLNNFSGNKSRNTQLKRKRAVNGSKTSLGSEVPAKDARRSAEGGNDETTALRIRYGNGQEEELPLFDDPAVRDHMTEHQKRARRIAKAVRTIRRDLERPWGDRQAQATKASEVLGKCAAILEDVDEAISTWTYPLDPTPDQVHAQRTMRAVRERIRRFVQTAGTISRVLGGQIKTLRGISPLIARFVSIECRGNDLQMPDHERFANDFARAILLWLDSGIGRLIEDFSRASDLSKTSRLVERLPIPETEATIDALDLYLLPYLQAIADADPLFDPETSQFETDESRTLYAAGTQALEDFAAAVQKPFADLSLLEVSDEPSAESKPQDRAETVQYWALKVARALMLKAAGRISIDMVDEAFGGIGHSLSRLAVDAGELDSDLDSDVELDQERDEIELLRGSREDTAQSNDAPAESANDNVPHYGNRTTTITDADMEHYDNIDDNEYNEEVEDGEDSVDDDDDIEEDDSSDPDEVDGVPIHGLPRFMDRSALERRRIREGVGLDVPCHSHTRVYAGHCNVRTIKDVNYFGPDDEYVVSGSDDGNLFIWDRKTGELINILEGDGEVVNVVQGHPYETMMAVSGIDHSIKIFSADNKAREAARLGRGVSAADPAEFSSLAWPSRVGRRRMPRRDTTSENEKSEVIDEVNEDAMDDYVAPKGLPSRRRIQDADSIINSNDVARRRGNEEAILTRSMLHQLAQRIRAQRAANGGDADIPLGGHEIQEDEEGRVRIVLGDDCVVM